MQPQRTFVGGFNGRIGGFGGIGVPVIVVQSRCILCPNVANPGKNKCQSCYIAYKQQQQWQQQQQQQQWQQQQWQQQQWQQQQFMPPSPSPYANWATQSQRRVCCNKCGSMVSSGSFCCGKKMW